MPSRNYVHAELFQFKMVIFREKPYWERGTKETAKNSTKNSTKFSTCD